jgi:hypothetical protein
MDDKSIFIIVVVCVAIVALLYWWLKPYFIKYDTTLLFVGGLGSGKTLNSVKTALQLYKKNVGFWKWCKFKNKVKNLFRSKENKIPFTMKKPKLYSNIPIKISGPLSKKEKYSEVLTKEHLSLQSRIVEYSVVLIDEAPLLVNQFNYNLEIVKNNVNEFIALFRHYVGGYLILNGQAESEIVKQIRVKLNVYYWCFDFKRFWKFYSCRVLQNRVSEESISLNSEFVEEKTKKKYGILTKRYNSRCYCHRYEVVPMKKSYSFNRRDMTTDTIISFNKEVSTLNKYLETFDYD